MQKKDFKFIADNLKLAKSHEKPSRFSFNETNEFPPITT